jgi:hypothetical protein
VQSASGEADRFLRLHERSTVAGGCSTPRVEPSQDRPRGLLTGLGATAYLVRTPAVGESLRISAEAALAAVCSLAAMELAVLWMIDQLTYQGFLDAIFMLRQVRMPYCGICRLATSTSSGVAPFATARSR